MTTEAADLEKFLKQVDQISELVKEMNSSDAVSQQRAAEKADQLISAFKENGETEELCKTRLNRTVINNKPERNEAAPCGLRNDADTSQALKEMGNEAFAKGDYETAVQRYSEGLEKLRDMQVLYTNRAQECKLSRNGLLAVRMNPIQRLTDVIKRSWKLIRSKKGW
ncbi:Tetratricopeptide repeat protein 12 [Acipenser ruthenus]|uniref:Tetratricopeptide repeat protein 12 n=1 Tax=Acipenser ruthenus TaxID=7906 RepID=A0A444V006_ACIRT|nr:Tetratricopeptide repeat protein 12 [Acipenser ruthenus]